MPPEFGLSTLGQISMNVKDLARATAFYRDTLGVPFLFEVPNLAFFDLAGVRLMLSPPEGPELDHAGSVLYFRVADIGAAHAELAGRGVVFVDEPHVIADMGTYTLWMTFFHDSEGNLLSLMSEVATAGS
jgi:catechol 2,3-dioxygenase-like lactoylglutathione lyase family enzyme